MKFTRKLQRMFEGRIDSLSLRLKKDVFKPKWVNNPDAHFRLQIMERLKRFVASTVKGVMVVPVWHGTKKETAKEIAETGFANLVK